MTTAPEVLACEVCGGRQFRLAYAVTDTNQDVPGRWHIAVCDGCGLGRLDPMPAAGEVSTFYRDVFYADEGLRFRPWMEALRGRLAAFRARRLNRLMPQRGRLLDFGAGAGHFAAAARLAGWQAVAVDPYNEAGQMTSGARVDEGRICLEYGNGAFDAVTLWYVFEHLLHPRAALRELHRVLRSGGMLVLAQQDFSSLQARFFRQRWLFLDPPRHLYHFAPATLARLAEEEGFRVRSVTSASLEMGPFTILQSVLNCVLGNQNDLFRFLKHRRLSAAADGTAPRALTWRVMASLVASVVLAPLALLAYVVLLMVGSGDTFAMYLEKTGDRPS